jgi:hypothetical protein
MGDAAITHKGGTKDYWVRSASPHVVNFAKGSFGARSASPRTRCASQSRMRLTTSLLANEKLIESRRFPDNSPRSGAYAHSSTA